MESKNDIVNHFIIIKYLAYIPILTVNYWTL